VTGKNCVTVKNSVTAENSVTGKRSVNGKSSVTGKSSVVDKSNTVIFITQIFFPINQNLVQELIYIVLLTDISVIIKIRMQYQTGMKPSTNHNLPSI
jgi:hypothetical protein